MNANTLEYALCVLNKQHENVLERKDDVQRAYYTGLKAMLDIIVSDGYLTNAHIERCGNGLHYLINE